jgi:hypothetical protein
MSDKPDANSTNEIEITREMIEAAADALAEYDRKFESLEEAAQRILNAALKLRTAARET